MPIDVYDMIGVTSLRNTPRCGFSRRGSPLWPPSPGHPRRGAPTGPATLHMATDTNLGVPSI
jgi:hypothetical protein